MSWRVTVRIGPDVEQLRADDARRGARRVELNARAASNAERRETVDVRVRRYEPGDQVAARVELNGPGVAVGVDVRGDGAIQAWTGRWPAPRLEPEDGETPFEALRRALQSTSVEP